MSHRLQLTLVFLVLFLAGLACEVNVGGPERPGAPIPVSTEAVESLKNAWAAAFAEAQSTGSVTLTLTESQVTSFLAFNLGAQEDPLLSDPQVYLRSGQMQIYGTATSGNLTGTVRIVMMIEVSDLGEPELKLASADFGPLPVPDNVLSALSSTLDEAFTGQFGPVATGLRIEAIAITDGVMIIAGRTK